MSEKIIKKIIPVDYNLSLKDCQKVLNSGEYALGIIDENREITSYVLAEHIKQALKFEIDNMPISTIATLCKNYNVGVQNDFREEYFIGDNPKNIDYVVVYKREQSIFVNLKAQYDKVIESDIKQAINLCSEAADKINLPIYLIGGIVRDIILENKCFDIDITVEEDATKFAEFLQKTYPEKCFVKEIHNDFKTAKILFKINGADINIDLASTRQEIYAYPASLPVIKKTGCSLEQDVRRRDFTINSMALSLNRNSFGNLIDYLCGYEDLKNKKLKILHPLSFIDDPTRIIRGLKFAVRFGFEVDEITFNLQKECLDSGIFDNLMGERVKLELKQALSLNSVDCYNRILSDKVYKLIFNSINPLSKNLPDGDKIQKIINKHINYVKDKSLIWLIYLGCLCIDLSSEEVSDLIKKLNLNSIEAKILISGNAILKNKKNLLKMDNMFDAYEFFECHFIASILIALAATKDETIIYYIEKYLNEMQFVSINTTGKTLIKKGFNPGPEFGHILRDILREKINGNIITKEDEEVFLDKLKEKASQE